MPHSVSLLTLQFLAWVDSRPRTYAEARQAWRSTCPTTCAWEDALSESQIEFETGGGRLTDRSPVVLSARGRAALQAKTEVGETLAPSIAAQ
ncbi:MAG TPA: hypothetical protein VN823_01755 [Stellaceae bacterium]|nr:hypothetical protein [Stellaceae bacterium]